MKTLFLKIYSIHIKISTNSDFVFENIKKDFILYLRNERKGRLSNGITINIFKEKAPYWKIPALEASLYGLGAICYKNKDIHYVDYAGRGLMIYNFSTENADVYSEDESLLYEKARLAILSRVGEVLDNRHVHRIHAVGFSKDNKATICILPMGAGKTTLAINVLREDNGIKLISDDVCFIDFRRYAYPFMLRIGVRDVGSISGIPKDDIVKIYRSFYGEKYLIDLAYFKGRISEESKIYNILIGKRVFQEETEIKKIPKIKCLIPFIQSGVFGLGLPQIVELFLRSGFLDILEKIKMIFSRSLLFLIIICRANTYEIKIGRDMERCIDGLINFLNEFTNEKNRSKE